MAPQSQTADISEEEAAAGDVAPKKPKLLVATAAAPSSGRETVCGDKAMQLVGQNLRLKLDLQTQPPILNMRHR